MLPTRPAMPRHKGKIEAGVKFAQNNALKGRSFDESGGAKSVSSPNGKAAWPTRASTAPRGSRSARCSTKWNGPNCCRCRRVCSRCSRKRPRTVHRDGYVELQRAYYSVPPEYVGRQVWVRWESRLVRVFNQRREVIAVHVLAEPGKFATDPTHLHSPYRRVVQHESGLSAGSRPVDRRAHRQLGRERWCNNAAPSASRVLHGLLALAEKHPVKALESGGAKSPASRHLALARPAHLARTSRPVAATGLSGNASADPQPRHLPGLCARLLCPINLNHEPNMNCHLETTLKQLRLSGLCQTLERAPAGSRRQPAQPCRVPGTHPAGRTQRPPATADGTPHQAGGLPPPENPGGL